MGRGEMALIQRAWGNSSSLVLASLEMPPERASTKHQSMRGTRYSLVYHYQHKGTYFSGKQLHGVPEGHLGALGKLYSTATWMR